MKVSADVRFAVVPDWVIFADIGDKAVRLYGVLARHTNTEGEATVYRKTLAASIHCSPDSIDRALKELVAIGALEIHERWSTTKPGQRASNEYVLKTSAPVRGGRMDAAGGGRTDAAVVNESTTQNERTTTDESVGRVQKIGKTGKPNPAFDALAELHGGTAGLSRQMAKTIGVALAGIKRATPNVGPDEIHRRVQGYRRLPWNRERAMPSASALAKWWADCDRPEESSRPAPSPGLDESWLDRAGEGS